MGAYLTEHRSCKKRNFVRFLEQATQLPVFPNQFSLLFWHACTLHSANAASEAEFSVRQSKLAFRAEVIDGFRSVAVLRHGQEPSGRNRNFITAALRVFPQPARWRDRMYRCRRQTALQRSSVPSWSTVHFASNRRSSCLRCSPQFPLRYAAHVEGKGTALFECVCELDLDRDRGEAKATRLTSGIVTEARGLRF